MIVVEIFERSAAPRGRPRVIPGPELRDHDDRGHFIIRRRMPLPVPQPRCLGAAEHSCYAARHTNIALSKSAAPSLRPRQLALLRRPSHHSHKPPARQIAIDRDPHLAHRGFLPWRLSDAGPRAR
jgi:hypothetical protein